MLNQNYKHIHVCTIYQAYCSRKTSLYQCCKLFFFSEKVIDHERVNSTHSQFQSDDLQALCRTLWPQSIPHRANNPLNKTVELCALHTAVFTSKGDFLFRNINSCSNTTVMWSWVVAVSDMYELQCWSDKQTHTLITPSPHPMALCDGNAALFTFKSMNNFKGDSNLTLDHHPFSPETTWVVSSLHYVWTKLHGVNVSIFIYLSPICYHLSPVWK